MTEKLVVKICGITRPDDALAACAAGADLLGFVFHEKSPRHLPDDAARALAALVNRHYPAVRRVGLFVNKPAETVLSTCRETGMNLAQLHGHESPAFCTRLAAAGLPVIKAFRFGPGAPELPWSEYGCELFLADTYHPQTAGGTGISFDPALLPEGFSLKKTLLAGGLTPENVADAVSRVRPLGVDVSSGVEESPGRKSPDLIRRFIRAARAAAGE